MTEHPAPRAAPPGRHEETALVLRDLAWTVHRRGLYPPGRPGLPVTELAVLTLVREHPGLSVGEVTRRLGLQQPNTSAAVRTLVERGLVRREAGTVDRRVTLLHPTDAAQAEHEALAEVWAGPVRDALRALDPEQAAAIAAAADALRALEQHIRTDTGPA
ncbi:MarR family winged helix-turn-helix transcriptional regulator [Promicromonospora thailandica]|uniref:DNA-binding transcriptional regulator, MarR family n=1 Tax=Promicromonospora thailandica TaxID=765201 RepID=A0A9X2K0G8_9MICO|nr:MarR family transcriptional regulator [Promicromonospora thailandica]MCP2267079.1 DNA-binding transcriptional regulator, MarR family [Promicromonospora thailandica]BFF16640.1 hypothetical protein GCM10025730_01610 [Promicromonospora thailandica]